MQKKKAGAIQIVQLVSGCTVNDIRAYLKEYTEQTGIRPDGIVIDYLDLMMPAQKKVPPSDLFIKDKFVSEELRNLSVELDILFATASQLNRGAVDEIEFDHSHIAGGLSKIQTADNVIGIFSSRAMRERGRIQIQFMKTRSSSGVGQKVDLEFDINTLRLRDLSEEESSEVEADKYNLNYIKLDGEVGCMVNGAGLAMATMDIIKLHGGEPANFLDVGGVANAETVAHGFKIILSDKNVKSILLNIFGGIVRCDRVAQGVIDALDQVEVNIPVVNRLEGTNAEAARELLQNSEQKFIVAESLADAAEKAVKALGQEI